MVTSDFVSGKGTLKVVIFSLFVQSAFSAMVAQDKVIELVQQFQHQMLSVYNESEAHGSSGTDRQILAAPVSLQLAVLQVTDSLTREMSLSKWQAMLRALGGDREILKRFAQLRPRFSALETEIGQNGGVENELNKLASMNSSIVWRNLWPQLQTLIHSVSNLHDWFDRYQRNSAVVNERTLRDYAETVHGRDGLTTSKALESIHEVVVNQADKNGRVEIHGSGGAFEVLHNAIAQADSEFTCSLSKSAHHLVYDFYTLLALTDAKGYVIMQFSWMLLRLYGKDNFTTEAETARAEFEQRMVEKAQAARHALSGLETWMWKCDTPVGAQLENQTYIQFTEMLQGYIVNEVDLNQDNSCKESCSAYTNSQEKGCFANQFCSQSRRCSKGRVYNCEFVEADSNVCTTNATGRRYDWIKYKSGRQFGRKSECNTSGLEQHRVDSWWRWFWHCSYCACLCDQPGPHSDRYVSLQSSMATTSKNHIVTGVRFVKKNRIVHIQIQEGQALPKGSINGSTIVWQPVVPLSVPKHREESTEDGPGYATLRYEERALDLDDLIAPSGQVITGLRFRKIGGHLNLEVQATPIEFSTGILHAERATWISNDNTPAAETKPRTKITLTAPDIPIYSKLPSVPDSSNDTYIEFQASSLGKDVSQTTVPFLDATPVGPQPSTWLTGVGIYHKGQPGYGGYLAFRLSTYNFSDHLLLASEDIGNMIEDDTPVLE